MENKYYWFSCICTGPYQDQPIYDDGVTDKHPFELMDYYNKLPSQSAQTTTLLNWKEITEYDYSLYKQIEDL